MSIYTYKAIHLAIKVQLQFFWKQKYWVKHLEISIQWYSYTWDSIVILEYSQYVQSFFVRIGYFKVSVNVHDFLNKKMFYLFSLVPIFFLTLFIFCPKLVAKNLRW